MCEMSGDRSGVSSGGGLLAVLAGMRIFVNEVWGMVINYRLSLIEVCFDLAKL